MLFSSNNLVSLSWNTFPFMNIVLVWKSKNSLSIFSPHLGRMKTWNFTSGATQYLARWETGDSLAVTSIKDRYFRSFSIPLLFFLWAFKIPSHNFIHIVYILCTRKTTQEQRNRETSNPVLMSQHSGYHPQSSVLRSIVPQPGVSTKI